MRLRSVVILMASALVWAAPPACARDQKIRVVRHEREVSVSRGEQLAAKLVALAQSTSVNSTAYAVGASTWTTILNSDSFLLVSFSKPRTLRLVGRSAEGLSHAYQVHSLLLPLPSEWPPHVYVKTDQEIISVTKYDPRVMRRLVMEPELQLSKARPYSSLISIRGLR
jgi:hypothetical protein